MKIKPGARVSKNILDVRVGKPFDPKASLGNRHKNQIFNEPYSKKVTSQMNKLANADRAANKGRGAQAMKSPVPTKPKPSTSVANKWQNLPRKKK